MGAMLERLPRNRRNIGLALVAVLVLWFAWSIRSVINPLILGYMLAAIVVPIVRGLTKRGWSHRTSVVVVFAGATLMSLLLAVGMVVQMRFLVADLMPHLRTGEVSESSEGRASAGDTAEDEAGARDETEETEGANAGGPNTTSSPDGTIIDVTPETPAADSSASTSGGDANEGTGENTSVDANGLTDGEANGSDAGETQGSTGDGSGEAVADGDGEDSGRFMDTPDTPLTDVLEGLDEWVEANIGIANISQEVRSEAEAIFGDPESEALETGGRVAAGVLARLRNALETIFGLSTLVLLVPLYAFFWMFEMDAMHDWVRRHIPVRERGRTTRLAAQMGDILSRFFRGRLTICVVKGVLITVCLAIAGIPYSILLGMLAGVLSLVPFVGSVAAFAFGALVALGTHDPWWAALLITGAIYGAAELVEGYVLMPRILGESLGLSEVAVLFAVTAGGAALGLFGVLAALPLAAAVKVLFTEYVDPALTQWAEENSSKLASEDG